jgi:hypothetical protein
VPEGGAGFYREPGPKLSQGDIVNHVPWGIVDNPLSVCQPADKNRPEGKAQYAPASFKLKGGRDAFANGRSEWIHAIAKQGLGMVLWHDCAIDKFDEKEGAAAQRSFAGVVPVFPLATLQQPDARQAVRDGDVLDKYYLEPHEAQIPESYVDLRLVWPVRQAALVDRIVTLGLDARAALYDHLFTFLTRNQLRDELLCPACFTPIDAADVFDQVGGED